MPKCFKSVLKPDFWNQDAFLMGIPVIKLNYLAHQPGKRRSIEMQLVRINIMHRTKGPLLFTLTIYAMLFQCALI